MNTPNPTVSVIIPTFNGARYLARALESVAEQHYEPLEVIVIDDGSTDGTADVAAQFAGVRVIRQPNSGIAAARNAGLDASQGALIAFLDHDDWWLPEKLRIQVQALQTQPELGYVVAHQQLVLEPGHTTPAWVRTGFLNQPTAAYILGTLVAWRWVFERVGTFDPQYRISDDSDWFARANDAGIPHVLMPDLLLMKGVHSSNTMSNIEVTQRELLHLLRRSVLRRRDRAANATDGGGHDPTA